MSYDLLYVMATLNVIFKHRVLQCTALEAKGQSKTIRKINSDLLT